MGMGRQGQTTPTSTVSITMDQGVAMAQSYLKSLNNPDLAIHEVMEFEYNFYIIYYEKSTGVGAFEMLIWKQSPSGGMMGGGMGIGRGMMVGTVVPEPGPNMMWNTKYSMMGNGMRGGGMMGPVRGTTTADMPTTIEQAKTIAMNYLQTNLPGATIEDPDVFYGYYTVHILRDGKIHGMLSVNGYTGQVWYHNWHGAFIQVYEFD
jgi:hypothetical protein